MDVKEAIALLYNETNEAPIILAKEKGALAEKMIELAEKQNIPICKDNDAVEVLSLAEVGQCIPEYAYSIIAKIFVFIRRNQ